MAWYNNWHDFTGDVSDIAHGHNPMNNPPPVSIPAGGPPNSTMPFGAHSTGQTTSPYQTMPTDDPLANQGATVDGGSGGGFDWTSLLGDAAGYLKDHAGDILKTGGSAANAYLDYAAKQAAIAERKREFDQTNQLAQGNQAMMASSQFNRAPLADKGQYLALNMAAPTAFHPRDYTQGLSNIQAGNQPSGGAGAQLAANAAASANYKPGAGGFDTSTLKTILSRIGMPQGGATTDPTKPDLKSILDGPAKTIQNGINQYMQNKQNGTTPTTPGSTTTVNYGGQQYNPTDWQSYLDQHPEMRSAGY